MTHMPPTPGAADIAERVVGRTGQLLAGLGVAAFAVTLTSTILGVLARFFALTGLEWTFEVAAIGFLWTTFLGAALAETRGENVAFALFSDRARGGLKRALRIGAAVVLAVLAVKLAWSAGLVVNRSGHVPTPLLRWPNAVISLSLLAFALAAVLIAGCRIVSALRGDSGASTAPGAGETGR